MTLSILLYPAHSGSQYCTPNHIITISITDDVVSAVKDVHLLIKWMETNRNLLDISSKSMRIELNLREYNAGPKIYTFCSFAKTFVKRTALMETSLHVAMADSSTLQRDLSLRTIDVGSEDCLATFNFRVSEGVMTFASNPARLFERARMEEEEEHTGAMDHEENESETETR